MFSTELKHIENRGDPPLRLLTLEDAEVALSCVVSRENKKGPWHLRDKECYGNAEAASLSNAED